VQAGIGLPLFFGSQKSKISALRINKEIAENNYITGVKNLQSEYQQVLLNYNKHLQTVTYFENTALKNAELILTTANKQFANGDINYLEWVLLINQSVSIKSDYVDAVKNLNQSAIQLNSLTNK
jgi:cobalt-zinc-cadmium resistance protein CzcA